MNPASALLLMILVMPAGAQQEPGIPQGRDEPVLQPHNPRYQLRAGDTLELKFRFTPEFDQQVSVQPDGFINLRELPDLHVAGKTTPELTEMLRKNYSRLLRDPVITVLLKEFEKPYFTAQGELLKPGRYDLRGATTVLEAIGMAGGFNDKAKHSQVLLFHRVSDQWTAVTKIDVKQMLAGGDLSEDLQVRPGDMIYVPKNALSKVRSFIPSASVGMYPGAW